MSYGASHRGEHHRRDVDCRAACELEHRRVGLLTKLAAREREILVRVGAVEADRDDVDDSFELGRDITAVAERTLAVGVDAHRQLRVLLHPTSDLLEHVKCFHGLSISAEDEFGVTRKVELAQPVDDLPGRGFAFEPEDIVAVDSIGFVADAEGAAAWATIGEVDVERVADLVQYVHHLGHM